MHGSRNILARCLTLRGRNRRRPRRAFTMLELQVAVLLLAFSVRSEEHTSELQSRSDLVCRLLLEKKKHIRNVIILAQPWKQVPTNTSRSHARSTRYEKSSISLASSRHESPGKCTVPIRVCRSSLSA